MTRPDTATKLAFDVSKMFDEVSPRYDLINDVVSAGQTRLWRIATTKALQPRKGMRILDLAAGTGTSSAAIAKHGAHVTAADFSEGMLEEGRRRHADDDLIDFVWADATELPFDDDSFDAATISYGLRNVNDVVSAGQTRLWRIATTKALQPRKGMRILDLAAGTGTSSAAFAKHGAHVTAADFSEGMLEEGRRRHADDDLIDFIWADATELPFDDDSFDAATISYGLRNVDDPRKALAEMFRVVRPGGRVVIAEFSTPPSALVRRPYEFYGRHVLPRIAGLINRNTVEAYRYLNESIEQWPAQAELAGWLREAGFERVGYRNLTLGIVALHRGFVPRESGGKSEQAAV